MKNRHKKMYRYLSGCILVGVCLIVIVALQISSEVHSKVENYTNVDYAIVLGAGLEGDKLSNRLRMRLDLAFDQMKDQEIPIIVSGGQGPDEEMSEADAMCRYLVEKGIEPNRLILEDRSTSTQENIKFSNELMGKTVPCVVIFTSDYHMYRAKMLGERTGWKVEGYSVVNPLSTRVYRIFREILAVMKDTVVYE